MRQNTTLTVNKKNYSKECSGTSCQNDYNVYFQTAEEFIGVILLIKECLGLVCQGTQKMLQLPGTTMLIPGRNFLGLESPDPNSYAVHSQKQIYVSSQQTTADIVPQKK